MSLHDWTAFLRAALGYLPADPAEARRQQERVAPRARHSRRLVTPAEAQARRLAVIAPLPGYGAWRGIWGNARLLADAGLTGAAALCVIAASGNGVARVAEGVDA